MMHPLQRVFSQIYVFSQLNGDELQEILRALRPVTLARNERLFRQDDPGDAAYIIQSGHVEVLSRTSGHEVSVATLGPRQVLGEFALIDGAPRSASARGLERTELFRLDKREFDYLRQNQRPAAYKVMRAIIHTLCERMRETNDQIVALLAEEEKNDAPVQLDAPAHWVSRMLGRMKGSQR